MAGSDKTEQPTPKRRREARKKGQVARSHELVSWTMVVVALVMLPGLFDRGRTMLGGLLYGVRDVAADPQPERMGAVLSSAFSDLHLGTQEVRILHFHKTLEGYLERGRAERARAGKGTRG